ncbi:MAG: pyrophosphate--fructose-6-phosphate 1-phosphotransferase [Puniceicoccales bacterium]|jgi:pyrophosphate--fructose-6-phosphate 1-phosphotransferase|nr:pyrophosphate--fructose-6-phosphate 1-phosphotransferase [Puniceicoccales bacterium]
MIVGILTAGGIAPCLSAAVGNLIKKYTKASPETEIILYKDGYKGLLLGDKIVVTQALRKNAEALLTHGGSAIGNSRVKLTNLDDCVKRGYVSAGQDPRQVAARQLVADKIDVLHTLGGDDTNTAAADLAEFLKKNGYNLAVIGLPKTIDNDVYPISQSLGALTAAEYGAKFFANLVYECTASPRMLIVHEVMGRHCGWLTAKTAHLYRQSLKTKQFIPEIGLPIEKLDIHGIYLPELQLDIEKESARLCEIMDRVGCVNIFMSEGACLDIIVEKLEKSGTPVKRDPFGHVKLDQVNPGQWLASEFSRLMRAEKTLVQKSGYFARSAPANGADLSIIADSVDVAIQCARERRSGVIGFDEQNNNKLHCIEFSRIKGGKPFDIATKWFSTMLQEIGQGA